MRHGRSRRRRDRRKIQALYMLGLLMGGGNVAQRVHAAEKKEEEKNINGKFLGGFRYVACGLVWCSERSRPGPLSSVII